MDNGAAVFENMVAESELSHDGEIDVVPAHGKDPGEYVAKLGRVWMPKINGRGLRENWSMRLNRLLSELEKVMAVRCILYRFSCGYRRGRFGVRYGFGRKRSLALCDGWRADVGRLRYIVSTLASDRGDV